MKPTVTVTVTDPKKGVKHVYEGGKLVQTIRPDVPPCPCGVTF